MPWQDSRMKPPPKEGVYRLKATTLTYSYWNGEYFNWTSSSKENAARYTNKKASEGGQRIWWEEGVDQPYMTKNADNGLPARNGAAWSIEEEEQLLKERNSGLSIKDIASRHQRVENAIEIRLERLSELTNYNKKDAEFAATIWDKAIYANLANPLVVKTPKADKWDLESSIGYSSTAPWTPNLIHTSRNKLLLTL